MSEHQQSVSRVQRTAQTRYQDAVNAPRTKTTTNSAAFDSLLDEIDSVLETDAEEYVRSFVQKGGQ